MTRLMDAPRTSAGPEDNPTPQHPVVSYTDCQTWLIGSTEYDWASAHRVLTREYLLMHSQANLVLVNATRLFRREQRSGS